MYHPELRRRARLLPRGLGRTWLVPLLRRSARIHGALVGRSAEYAPLIGGGSVYLFPPPEPVESRRPGLLWIHGGGLIMGDARSEAPFLKRVARDLGAVVASAQYRCAPEHPFPTPLRDCERAFRWLAERPDVDPTRLAIGGMSAGGGLTAALCQLLRDEEGPTPAAQVLVYPMLDDRSARGSAPDDRDHRVWDRRSNALGWRSYLTGLDRASPPRYAVPARTEDLSEVPPAWIGVGTADLFHDEDVAYAERLQVSGVPVQLHVIDGGYHGFDQVDPTAPVTRAFEDAQLAFLRSHIG